MDQMNREMKRERECGSERTAVISREVLVPVSPPEVRKEPFSPSLAHLRT